jgi:POT family proton-dependent oligopeptide transporter
MTTRGEFWGHPRGLLVICGTELWERISFHGMQALLVLYMVEHLLLPGHVEEISGFADLQAVIERITGPLSVQALATQIFGLYVGLTYFTPVFGGLLGDRVLGRRHSVTLGALLMTVGHFCMTFDRLFLMALLLLILGAGILRGNLISQVGDLYGEEDSRRESGFQIYYSLVNTGAFFAPLITGVLSSAYGWHIGFGFAGFGMLLGLTLYVAGRRYLPADAPRGDRISHPSMSATQRRTVTVIALMLPLLTLFWVAQSQVWNTYNLWVRDHVDLLVGGWRVPVPWLQAVDGLAAVVMVPPVLLFWRWQAAHASEPDDFRKLAIGCIIFGAALMWLAAGQWAATAAGKIPLGWALGFHGLSSVGYVYFAPTAVAVISRKAPAAVNALMIGVYYLTLFIGSIISGRLGSLYERLSTSEFWLLHAAIVSTGGMTILLVAPKLRRELTCP